MSDYHVVNFSGGKDSTAMLLLLIEKNYPIDEIIFVDTTKEFPEILENVDKVEQLISPLKITRLKLDFDYFFSDIILVKGKNKGKSGYGWPDFRNRWCTTRKIRMMDNYLDDIKYTAKRYIGLACDEKHRVDRGTKYKNVLYPLVDWKMTEQDCLKYCYSRGLDLGGLYNKFSRVSCYCCPLQRVGELRTLYNDYPALWDNMLEMDKRSPRKFRKDKSLQDFEDRFTKENMQMELDKADASLFHGNNFAVNQRMNFVFTNAVNEHKAPVISPVINEDSEEEDFASYSWVGVTNDGTVPPVVPGSYINNLSKDTLFNLVKSENSSMKGRITDAISLGTHILFCGEFTGLSGDQASLMLLNLATNRFEPFPIQGVEHGSAKSLSGYDNYIFGMFFVNNTWTNIIQFDRSDYSVVWTTPYRFIDVQDKDVIGDYRFRYFTIPGVGHFGTNREILDSMAVSSDWHVMLNKHSLISRHNVICPVAHEILGNSLHEIYAYDDSDNYCKILDALGNVLGTLNKPGKPKVLRNHEEARLLYGNEVWHVIVDNVSTKVASVDGADEINASVSATVGGVSSEIVFGKNITVSSETGIGYVYGLNRFIGTGLD